MKLNTIAKKNLEFIQILSGKESVTVTQIAYDARLFGLDYQNTAHIINMECLRRTGEVVQYTAQIAERAYQIEADRLQIIQMQLEHEKFLKAKRAQKLKARRAKIELALNSKENRQATELIIEGQSENLEKQMRGCREPEAQAKKGKTYSETMAKLNALATEIILTERSQGESWPTIASILNLSGIRNSVGNVWIPITVKRLYERATQVKEVA